MSGEEPTALILQEQPPAALGLGELSPAALARIAEAVGEQHQQPMPTQIGRYRLVEQIGEGGMGVVYKAEQDHPIRRTVALKLIKLGMASADVVARFDHERQALAWMDHPNVAKVLDAGADPLSGRPYFVMEHVSGAPITRYCDEHRLTVRQRLELFGQVCAAVAHAHQKMIVHRDLKPSNILVGGEGTASETASVSASGRAAPGDVGGVVKVIDFGVAKALVAGLSERTMCTQSGQLLGTPEYMSPEQACDDAQDVDTRSDIYSLGVILYELLAGALPFDPKALRGSGPAGIERTLREIDPPRPSTRLSSLGAAEASEIAQRRQTRISELTRQLKGELEWIPLKAMRKERGERYATAQDLAQDIANYLHERPLIAGPESRAYRLRKFLRRRRAAVIAASLVAASLLAGIVGTATFAVRESRQRAQADRNAEETRRVADFQAAMLSKIKVPLMGARLHDDILDQAKQSWQLSRMSNEEIARRTAALEENLSGVSFTTAALRSLDRNIFDTALEAIDTQFAAEPTVKARLLQHVATTLSMLGQSNRALAPQTQALQIRQRVLGEDHLDTLDSHHRMAGLLARLHPVEAEPHARAALDGRRRILGDTHKDTLSSCYLLGVILQWQSRGGEAERYQREALEGRRSVLGNDDPATILSIHRMGQLLLLRNRLTDAEPYLLEALERANHVLGADHETTLLAVSTMARLLHDQGKFDEAQARWEEALEGYRRTLGDDHRDTMFVRCKLCALMIERGRLDDAERYLKNVTAQRISVLGEGNADALESLRMMAQLRWRQGRLDEAASRYSDTLQRSRRVRGPADPGTLAIAVQFANLLDAMGNAPAADQIRRQSGRDTLDAFIAWRGDGAFPGITDDFYALLGKVNDGGDMQRQYLEACRAKFGASDRRTLDARTALPAATRRPPFDGR